MNLRILAVLLPLAFTCLSPAVGGAEAESVETTGLSNVFVGMNFEQAEEILRAKAVKEVFTEGVILTYGKDGAMESQVFGSFPVGWKMDERRVIDLVRDEQGRVGEIQIFDERERNRGKDPYHNSMVKAFSVIFTGKKLVMIDGKEVTE